MATTHYNDDQPYTNTNTNNNNNNKLVLITNDISISINIIKSCLPRIAQAAKQEWWLSVS